MEIVVSVLIGACAGGLALLFCKSCQTGEWSTLAVGILGALLGMVSKVWIGFVWIGFLARFGTPILSGFGAVLMLLLWIVAQKLLAAALLGDRD